MCEEKQVSTKVCTVCGQERPITDFVRHGRSKDGYVGICKVCKAQSKGCNYKLKDFTPRELIEELKARGYTGKLVYIQRHEINL